MMVWYRILSKKREREKSACLEGQAQEGFLADAYMYLSETVSCGVRFAQHFASLSVDDHGVDGFDLPVFQTSKEHGIPSIEGKVSTVLRHFITVWGE
jgi:hypothetical protein